MQIFAPTSDFNEISKILDSKRLNKQKVEIFQILNVISKGDKAKGWKNHPAVKMVRGHEQFYIEYATFIIQECLERGFKDTILPRIFNLMLKFPNNYKVPTYWGNEKFHSSHRSALLAKNFDYYKKFNWKEEPIIDYWWPTKQNS